MFKVGVTAVIGLPVGKFPRADPVEVPRSAVVVLHAAHLTKVGWRILFNVRYLRNVVVLVAEDTAEITVTMWAMIDHVICPREQADPALDRGVRITKVAPFAVELLRLLDGPPPGAPEYQSVPEDHPSYGVPQRASEHDRRKAYLAGKRGDELPR